MPGTILVSVLEFMDLPLSPSTFLSVCMGKIEYQISDKGSISFPLTSLRDDLIFKIQDAEGNEISRSGVQIRLILEKGVWEDIFPLGDGHLHLKLQFILNDEERDRIRSLRQSALKKKHHELLGSSQRGEEKSDSSTVIGNAALPFTTNDEVSESPKKHLQHEAVSRLQGPVRFHDDNESDTRNVVGAQHDRKQLNTNIADQYKETSSTKPLSQAVNLTQLQHKGKKSANQSPTMKHPQRDIDSEELLSLEKNDVLTNNLRQPNLVEDGLQCSEKKTSPDRTPSNVRKMISAFESGLAQDKRSHIKPPPTKDQASTIERKDSSKIQNLEQDKSGNTEPSDFLQEGVRSASLNKSYVGTGTEGSKNDKIQEIEESKTKNSDNRGDENSRGPINQVIKVAIIVGFGLLVLLTRERKRSNSSMDITSSIQSNRSPYVPTDSKYLAAFSLINNTFVLPSLATKYVEEEDA
ncbi:hypothetical protein VNO77_23226 [Canavalia gladiata]|uniref:Uncharacterized protein n=1 Tax=Canavalia gladiata TaxID=3824 RepID=A0AAN9L426_CANGL